MNMDDTTALGEVKIMLGEMWQNFTWVGRLTLLPFVAVMVTVGTCILGVFLWSTEWADNNPKSPLYRYFFKEGN